MNILSDIVMCWPIPNGCAITRAAPGIDIHEIASSIIPDAIPRAFVEFSTLENHDFSDAWRFNLERGAVVDFEAAKEIHRNRIRAARAKSFQDADRAFMLALESGDEQARLDAVAMKNTLRALPNSPEIENASSLQALRDFWPTDLLGPSPYASQGASNA